MIRHLSKCWRGRKGAILHLSVLLLAITATAAGVYAAVPRFLQFTWPLTAATGATPGASIIPLEINHQGVITVNGGRFTGTGEFRFALIDPDTGLSVWTNDQTNVGTAIMPVDPVPLNVVDGIYTVRLGDTGLANMTPIECDAMEDNNLVLRIWFDDTNGNGIRQLLPDHPLSSVPYAFRAANGAMAGEIKIWAGPISTIPDGWLICDGSAVSRTGLSALFAAIGSSWGDGDGVTTFHLPDLRGRFLRGMSDGSGRDPNAASRTASNAGGNVADNVGSVQGNATRRPVSSNFVTNTTGNHNHTNGSFNRLVTANGTCTAGGADNQNPPFTEINLCSGGLMPSAGNHSHSIIGGGDSETRPINANVIYIIKM